MRVIKHGHGYTLHANSDEFQAIAVVCTAFRVTHGVGEGPTKMTIPAIQIIVGLSNPSALLPDFEITDDWTKDGN